MIKKWILFSLIINANIFNSIAQVNPITNNPIFQSIAENNGDVEIADDNYLQDLNDFLKHPVDLNKASLTQLIRLQYLTRLQIDNFIAYRNLLGLLTDIHELQAIPSWDLATIQNILPYVFISQKNQNSHRIAKNKNSLLFRYGRTIQQSKGYLIPDTAKASHYFGSPDKLFVRFKHKQGDLLQYGFTGSKDAGEEFFRRSQKNGFDFYSAHVLLNNVGICKTIILGDFSINLGQGLIQWQTLGAKKGTEVINIERQSEILKVYNSSGQVNFNRGAGATITKNHFEITTFISFKFLDANNKKDTLNGSDFVSSLKYSGYHRTKTEINDRGRLPFLNTGGNFSYNKNQLHIGFNSIFYHFGSPIKKSPAMYNKFAFSGTDLINNSVDWSFTSNNLRSFGEIAVDNRFSIAATIGALAAVSKRVDISFLFRSLSKSYHSFYGDAFTESGTPSNETGLFAGVKIAPGNKWNIAGYIDFFSFPWLKYRIDQPSAGRDFMIYADYVITKNLKWQSKLRDHVKPANFNPHKLAISPVLSIPKLNFSNQITFHPKNVPIEWSSKFDWIQYGNGITGLENGSLLSLQIGWYPQKLPFTLDCAYESFKTGTYNSRIYSLQTDVLYNVAVPPSYGRGQRILFNSSIELNNATLYIKYSNSIYPGKKTIGSGLDTIKGNHKDEIRFELIFQF
ncbi:MAG: helix-hairpin-helix domain-containing protein [Ginsengibacter sp.]